MVDAHTSIHPDSPEARRYNRIRRWLGIGDFALGFAFLVILLVTRWSDSLRDLAYRLGFQNYSFSLFVYLVLLLGISKALGIGLDYYGFRLERRFKLSNQRFSAWAWDEIKGFLLGLVLGRHRRRTGRTCRSGNGRCTGGFWHGPCSWACLSCSRS